MSSTKQKFFDSIATNWHKNHQFSHEDKAKILKILSSVKFSKQDFILDLGGGTGRFSEFLKHYYKFSLKFFVLDISGEMLKEGWRRLGSLKFHWIQGDSHYLPFKAEIFNHILCFSSFPHFEDKEKVLKEALRLLKKEGNFLIVHLQNREEINRFHAQKSFPISKDFLPSQREFENWVKKLDFFLKSYKDGKGYFFVHLVKK